MLPSPLMALHFKRMYGFAASLAAGLLLMFLVMINFTYPSVIVFVIPIKFALLFTFANEKLDDLDVVFFFGSTAFLVGPEQQINMMFLSTLPLSMLDASFLHSFCALLVASFSPSLSYNVYYPKLDLILIHSKILTVIAILCKTCALMWYNLSYIPFARRIVSEIMILSL
ncbi:hypothetical protein HID58_004462 [Brassica napus]|uniref:Vesicle transport protein n=1 Tax=Brassica napus TaxID=3708 RepID=A0ABQ8E5V3_BRANA|nr:hypothetical protein HID58_065286 [Brassica napus]KAH0937001.1 hypothetical protein HID58_004462 [Brassica napus]